MTSVATFSRRVIARYGPPAGVFNNASSSFRSKTVWGCGLLYGSPSNWKRPRAGTSAVPSHNVRTCRYPRLHPQAVWRPCGAAMG